MGNTFVILNSLANIHFQILQFLCVVGHLVRYFNCCILNIIAFEDKLAKT